MLATGVRPSPAQRQALWQYQYVSNPVVRQFADTVGPAVLAVARPLLGHDAAFVPIRAFKDHALLTPVAGPEPVFYFESSGTTGSTPSRHLVRDAAVYRLTSLHGFDHAFGPLPRAIFALLPHYLERGNSSLVQMVRFWVEARGLPGSGFFLHDFEALQHAIYQAIARQQPVLLIGVAYALLDFAASHGLALAAGTPVVETGGMKGRGREQSREELHATLRAGLGGAEIWSEYGMTELLSQAYCGPDGRFRAMPSLEVFVTDPHLPGLPVAQGHAGRICVVDHANVDSCAFIATDDLGRMYPDGSFEVLGRLPGSELRGCNLLYV